MTYSNFNKSEILQSGVILAVANVLFGKVDTALTTLFVFMVLDIVTGIMKAVQNQNLNSREMYKGGCRKAMKLLIVTVSVWLDKYTGQDIFRLATIGYMIATEGLSIIENAGEFIEIPQSIKKYLEVLKEKDDKDGGE